MRGVYIHVALHMLPKCMNAKVAIIDSRHLHRLLRSRRHYHSCSDKKSTYSTLHIQNIYLIYQVQQASQCIL